MIMSARTLIAVAAMPAVCIACSKPSDAQPAPTPAAPATTAAPAPTPAPAPAPTHAAAPATAAVFAISKVKPQVTGALRAKGKYVRVEFSATAKAKPEKDTQIVVKFACKVGTENMVEKGLAMGTWDDMDPNQTKNAFAVAWPNQPLDEAPKSCTLTFGTETLMGEPEWNLGDFCFVPPTAVTPGACAQ